MAAHLLAWLPPLAYGAVQAIELMLLGFLLAIVLGAIVCALRLAGGRVLARAAVLYIDVVRGTPLLAQLFFLYFGLAELGLVMSSFQAALLGLGLNSAAYIAEIFRAGIESVPRGQREAARSLGLRPRQIARLVTIPQIAPVVLPPLTNQSVVLLKETSIASLIAAPELMHAARDLASEYYMPLELYVLAGLGYLILALPLSLFARWVERRLAPGA